MSRWIVQSQEIVTLLGGGLLGPLDLNESRQFSKTLVAADGGAQAALAAGLMPDAVIGDFDSLGDEVRAGLAKDRLFPIPEQESTDFDKALRSIFAPLVLAYGFTGGRIDHELAVYNVLVRNPGRPCIVIGATDLCFHLSGDLALDLPVGTRVSLFPMARCGCGSDGLKWPTEGLIFDPAGRIGTSNAVVGPVRLMPQGPGMLVIVPREYLLTVVQAVLGAGWGQGGGCNG